MPNADIFHPPIPDQQGIHDHWQGLLGTSRGIALSNALLQSKKPLLLIAPNSQTASRILEEWHFFSNQKQRLHYFPGWETLPYDQFSSHPDIISKRLAVLSQLSLQQQDSVITTIDTLLYRLSPFQFLHAYSFVLKVGDRLNIDNLRPRLSHSGYRHVSQVREHGEFAVRGSIVDIFPMGNHQPFRIDLLDDEIESMGLFSPETQCTTSKITEINLLPGKEFPFTEEAIAQFRESWRNHFGGNPLKSPTYQDVSDGICPPGIESYLPLFFSNMVTLFDYLSKDSVIVLIEDIREESVHFWEEIKARFEQSRYDLSRPLLPPEQLFIDPTWLTEKIKSYPTITLSDETSSESGSMTFNTAPLPSIAINHQQPTPLALLQQFTQDYRGRILFCAESMGRREVMLPLLKSIHIEPTSFQSWSEFLDSDAKHGLVVAELEEGCVLAQDNIAIITETELYQKRIMQRRLRKTSTNNTDFIVRDLTELQLNDPVVHIQHGIGRYKGLETITIAGEMGEYVTLEYQDGDKLFVPITSLHLISRYTGADLGETPLHKLGTEQWQKAKRAANEKIHDVAAELLGLYAKRAERQGYTYQIDEAQYARFTEQFPFEETPDQLQATEQIFKDLMSDKPMDRVICGDVGFGKTEVAMRAAFLVIQNNRQVVVLVPTTLLAQQHFQNFQDRFARFPINIAMISRFRTEREQAQALSQLAEGKVDLIIGTHKLLQDHIKFNNLGLVIIDEEHRFGVRQKERLKALRAEVDILTMTATPIPRTLNMALSGMRDLSIIATPPMHRVSVKTFVHEYQKSIIEEAIQRELLRGGQVYFLHNDISTIHQQAEKIIELVKEARIGIAHGQMHERELEKIMADFYHRRINVLVCTTIVESGIDVPTANTIIINRADQFGIAQLHQLRGRVGRSHHQAYAYLFVPERKAMSDDAVKRLEAIARYDQLGIGFTLSIHDLEIRGAGELLGEEQSGNMREIGFSLYMDLLNRAIDALKSGKEINTDLTANSHGAEINLHITALIPEPYLNDIPLRLQFYKRVASAKTSLQLEHIQVEMIDRFGLLPEPLKNLFALSELKLKATTLGIIKLEASQQSAWFEFNENPNIDTKKLIRLIQDSSSGYKMDGARRLRVKLPQHEPKERMQLIEKILVGIQ